jgi:hypothetical protein
VRSSYATHQLAGVISGRGRRVLEDLWLLGTWLTIHYRHRRKSVPGRQATLSHPLPFAAPHGSCDGSVQIPVRSLRALMNDQLRPRNNPICA